MPDQTSPETDLLRAAYAAFNARDIDAALAMTSPTVAWPKAFKGRFVRGHEEIRAYWTEQWAEIDPGRTTWFVGLSTSASRHCGVARLQIFC